MWNEVQPVLQQFLVAVLTGILGVASAFLIAVAKKGFDWLSAKIDSIKQDDTRKLLAEANQALSTIVQNTVEALNQTLGDDIRASLAAGDGKYSKEDLLNLKVTALNTINKQLTQTYRDILETTYPALDEYISDLVETAVRLCKD